MNVLLGVTGSIAAKLTSRLEKSLYDAGHDIKVVITKSAEHFDTASYIYPVFDDEDELWHYKENNTVLHIDLVKWADLFLIAPCTGNTMNKIRVGIADNILTCCALAWDITKPMLLAPAMNTQMWENTKHREWNIRNPNSKLEFIPPQEKTLYCGDTGLGAMAEISDIVRAVNSFDSSRRVPLETV